MPSQNNISLVQGLFWAISEGADTGESLRVEQKCPGTAKAFSENGGRCWNPVGYLPDSPSFVSPRSCVSTRPVAPSTALITYEHSQVSLRRQFTPFSVVCEQKIKKSAVRVLDRFLLKFHRYIHMYVSAVLEFFSNLTSQSAKSCTEL